jgi:diacylglycerol kinase family enzyme
MIYYEGTTMRILVVHNPKAGREEHEGEDLIKALKRAGHKTIYQSSKAKGMTKALKKKIDLVLVAGGDGTVSKVASRLVAVKSEVPLSVLPLGIANNFARTLGFCLSQKELIERLSDGKCDTFDVGLARGPWGTRYFFEGAGAGLFAEYMKAPRRDGEKAKAKSKSEEMRCHVKALRRRLQHYRACRWEIELDGEDLSDRYLLWHAMNIRSVGPVLTLAAGAKTNDGAFDFVGAREKDRKVLLDYLKARTSGKRSKFPIPKKRFTMMRLRWNKAPLHFDDEHWPDDDKKHPRRCDIEIFVNDSTLKIWRIE